MRPRAVAFVAPSGTGKTTLIERVVAVLKKRGRRVGVLKHGAHGFEIDHPGKDTHRFAAAGADVVLITSGEKLALVRRHAAPPPVEEILRTCFPDVEIVLAEGFKRSPLPKVVVYRAASGTPLLRCGEDYDPPLVAVVGDAPVARGVPAFALSDTEGVADFLMAFSPEEGPG